MSPPAAGKRNHRRAHRPVCGSTDLMRLMNVRIPFRLTDKTSVLLAIDVHTLRHLLPAL